MSSTFSGIELAKRALATQQKSLEVVGHNIANANNENYSRQVAVQSTTDAYAAPSVHNSVNAGQMGTGVKVSAIKRIVDDYINQNLRNNQQSLSKWSTVSDGLEYIEMIFNELDSGGLTSNMNNFFDSFQELNNNPTDASVRETVVQNAVTLTTQINQINDSLATYRDQLGSEVETNVKKFNSIISEIADLNAQIAAVEDGNTNANDLMDKRDAKLDELSKLADIDYSFNNNQVNVRLNGATVVQGVSQFDLEITDPLETATTTIDGTNYGFEYYTFKVGGNEVEVNGGKIGGLLQLRGDDQLKEGNFDGGIIGYKVNNLDELTRELAQEVNDLHQTGYDSNGNPGVDFFVFNGSTEAGNMEVNQLLIDDPNQIAASSANDEEGNGSIALKIAQLKDKEDAVNGEDSFSDFWQTQASELGVDIDRAAQMKSNQQILVDDLQSRKEEQSGVSLDEEMTKMIQYQQGYNAAAKIISTIDQMIDTLINGIGR
ncbi:flagellar hook-associated protein FlgK [Orenia metallireducens]|uniref:Flagellar hook-associated protein 1 n=1 Tax=Orenia metallireducens TaxID=1413210 RepID=A0A1C0ABA1_9FIRM|nr:flagellar hook-associated protein FlgK [Orenia metallireducens]OCL27641.1 flagellar hook-associated protein FlgK [Orenia metallireducens]